MSLTPDIIAEREKSFITAVVTNGLRMTPQRLEIIREIAGADDHPDAEAVFRAVRERMPTLSQDTVYRTLVLLVNCGLVKRISMPRATRFDPDDAPHHHFICDRCSRVVDIGAESAQAHLEPEALLGIGDVRSVHVELRGVCSTCSD